MRRIYNPYDQKRHDSDSVKLAIECYLRVRNEFSRNRQFNTQFRRQFIHRQHRNKYFKIMLRVVEWLKEIREDNGNPLEYLLEDYFRVAFRYLWKFNRIANTSQMAPSEANKIRFLDWISDWEVETGECYFRPYCRPREQLLKSASESIRNANEAIRQIKESAKHTHHMGGIEVSEFTRQYK